MEQPREIKSIDDWPSNAELIADAAALGYFNKRNGVEGHVFDATYGLGTFWKVYRPARLTTNDLHTPADHAWDFTFLPVHAQHFDVVVFDPDYKLNGTPALGEQDERYGVHENLSRDERMEKIRLGAIQCYQAARVRVLVKCMDQVEGGRMRWQTDMVTLALLELGARKVDRFDFVSSGRPQPRDRKCPQCEGHGTDAAGISDAPCDVCKGAGRLPIIQRTARHTASQLLVFERPGR